MTNHLKKALRFYTYTALIGLSAFFLAIIGGKKADTGENFTSSLSSLGHIPTASADVLNPPADGGGGGADAAADCGDTAGGSDCTP